MGAIKRLGFSNLPDLAGCVILSLESQAIPPGNYLGGNKTWLEHFKLLYINRQGTENLFSWIEERK